MSKSDTLSDKFAPAKPKTDAQPKKQKAPSRFDQAASSAAVEVKHDSNKTGKQSNLRNKSTRTAPHRPALDMWNRIDDGRAQESSELEAKGRIRSALAQRGVKSTSSDHCTSHQLPSFPIAYQESISTHSDFISERTSAKSFFADIPWGKIPLHRQGIITMESCYPRGGLLGGSKLAALRKKRQEEAAKNSDPPAQLSKEDADKAIALLDRLNIKEKESTSSPAADSARQSALRKYPRKRSPSPEPEKVEVEEPEPEPAKPVIEFPNLRAKPSMFASTLCQSSDKRPDVQYAATYPLPYTNVKEYKNSNPFAGPSPDDIVLKAQARGAGRG